MWAWRIRAAEVAERTTYSKDNKYALPAVTREAEEREGYVDSRSSCDVARTVEGRVAWLGVDSSMVLLLICDDVLKSRLGDETRVERLFA